MSEGKIGKKNVGRIAERIVANELEYRGFLVRDLNLEGLAANVDLLAVKDGKLWQIQVKGSSYNTTYQQNGWWFQYGFCTDELIKNANAKMFNRSAGSFQAEIVVLVCVRSPKEYKCIVLPSEVAESAAIINLNYAYRAAKVDGSNHKPGKVWFSLYKTKARNAERQTGIDQEQQIVSPYENKWDFDDASLLSKF